MKNASLILALTAATALSAVAPAFAQTQYREVRDPVADAQYQRDLDSYNRQQNAYQNQTGAYNDRVDAYANDRVAYENRRSQYLRDRAEYDRRYGVGAYDRRYPDYYRDYYRPYAERYGQNDRVAFENRREQYLRDRAAYDRRYGSGAYDRRYPDNYRQYSATYADRYGVNTSAQVATCDSRNNATVGGLLGALAGAALGSNVAARNARTEGAVLGAVVGGAIGAKVGQSTARCDQSGYYYSYDQTQAYREAMDDRRGNSGRYNYSYYSQQRCRLAPAPTEYGGRMETRYVRVCPDAQGRYRITG